MNLLGIIYIGHIKRAPYLLKYTKILERNNIKYEIIYWNRGSNIPEQDTHDKYKAVQIHEFNLKSKEKRSPVHKVKDFLKFRTYVKEKIRNFKYEKLIILTTMSALIIPELLIFKYKKKFILDYRDASFENHILFKYILEIIFKKSKHIIISSEGFKSILPKRFEYILNHNINLDLFEKMDKEMIFSKGKYPLNISFIGGLRESDYMKELGDKFANNQFFKLNFHGGGENLQELEEYFDGVENINFTGAYKEEQKTKFIRETDILLYNYPLTFNNKVALANKYYDALIYKKPLIGAKGTFSGEIIENNGIGISLDISKDQFLTQLINYYNNLDFKEFIIATNKELDSIMLDEIAFEKKVYKFLK